MNFSSSASQDRSRSVSLEDLKHMTPSEESTGHTPPSPQKVFQVDSKGRMYATGKRKSSIARVWIKPEQVARFSVNGREMEEYFPLSTLRSRLALPFHTAKVQHTYSVWCTVTGGGSSGQAGAICHGISKALMQLHPELREPLKSAGLLTRDARRVERKKYGHRKARRSTQFCKR